LHRDMDPAEKWSAHETTFGGRFDGRTSSRHVGLRRTAPRPRRTAEQRQWILAILSGPWQPELARPGKLATAGRPELAAQQQFAESRKRQRQPERPELARRKLAESRER